jgi:hypothetical protein
MVPEAEHQSILDFLNASSSEPLAARCSCGAAMRYKDAVFFYEGQSWQLKIPVCPECDSATHITTHDA